MNKRKGAKSKATIPPSVLEQLNQGKIETANLVEFLAIDFYVLVEHVFQDFGKPSYINVIHQGFNQLEKRTVNTFQKSIGESLLLIKSENPNCSIIEFLEKHHSDVVRRWPCYYIGLNEAMGIENQFKQLEKFATDHHFGVREDAWLAVRNNVIKNLEYSISVLGTWIKSEKAYKRRFAIELLRPRGVWCKHINQLKENPEMVLPYIESLKDESDKYVQDSVANWLNDLSKSKPAIVLNRLENWDTENKNTAYICKRALRTIKKNNHKVI